MITLNDYLYSGDTVFRIIQKYIEDLRKDAKETRNEVDMMHCNFLVQILELLEHNEFLTVQSQNPAATPIIRAHTAGTIKV